MSAKFPSGGGGGMTIWPTVYDIELEIVHSLKYLGVTFYKNGNWHMTQKCTVEYGTYSLHNLYKTLSNIELPVSEKFKLFDSLVGSVLCYASEVWG